MITEKDLQEAIAECEGDRNPNANTCIKLAAFYTIRNELFGNSEQLPTTVRGYSGAYNDYDSGTEFSEAIKGLEVSAYMHVLDEAMETLQILNPRLYDGIIRKLKEL